MEASDSTTALTKLANAAQRISLVTAPEPVRRQARLCVLDTVGCIIAGTRTEEAALILACEPGDAADPKVSIPGTKERRSLHAAIRVSGYLGDILELNDLIGGHASIGNVTASLALAEAKHLSGAALLEAVIRGIEITATVYSSVYPTLKRFTEAGLVPVGIPSAIGSATAAAHLLRLDERQTLQAMAIAGTLAGWCPAEVIFGAGGTVKPMLHGAQPGETGVTAAFYARQGMTGPASLLESKIGYFATVSSAGRLPAEDDNWALMRPRRKLHACCGYLHSAADALGRLRTELGPTLADAAIEVRVPPYVAEVVGKDRSPVSANDARFHLQYCLALVATGETIIRPEHSIDFRTQLENPNVSATMRAIRVLPDPAFSHYHQSRVVAQLGNGRTHEAVVSAPRGSASEPLSEDEVIEKFLRLATPVLGAAPARELCAATAEIEHVDDVSRLMQLAALSSSEAVDDKKHHDHTRGAA